MTRSENDELLVYDVAVSARHRRRGVGRVLFRDLLEHGVVDDATDAFVLADGDDVDARAFYLASGGVEASVSMFTLGRAGGRA